MIEITDSAKNKITELLREENDPDLKLRTFVQGGGCSGFTYSLGFDAESKEGDMVITSDDIKLFIDGKSLFYLSGTELDFSDGLNGKGFVFNNPNATKTCGCGDSFSV